MGDKKVSTARWYENFVYIICIIFFSILIHQALEAKPQKYDGMQSMTFPKVIFGAIIILCAVKLIANIVTMIRTGDYGFEIVDPRIIISLIMIVLYAVLWEVIGFGLSSVLFVIIESKILRSEAKWIHCFFVSVGTTAVLYFVFGFLFNVDFPEPILNLIF